MFSSRRYPGLHLWHIEALASHASQLVTEHSETNQANLVKHGQRKECTHMLDMCGRSFSNWGVGSWGCNGHHFIMKKCYMTIIYLLYMAIWNHIARTNKCSICLWRTHELFLHRDVWWVQRMSQISLPQTMNVFSTDRLNMSVLLFLLHTIYLMDFCWFTLGTILYRKVVPVVLSPFRDHIKQAIVCNKI